MKERMTKLFSWETIRKVAVTGLGIIGGFALVSMLGVLPFVGTGLAVALSAISTAVAIGGLATVGVAAVAGAVKGLVNGLRYLFNSNYRGQTKERNKERKQQRENNKKKRLERKQKRKADREAKKAKRKADREARRAARKAKRKGQPTAEPVVAPEPVVKPKVEMPEKDKAKAPSKKAGGYYDQMSDENKKIYDDIIAKRSDRFSNFTLEEVAKFREVCATNVKMLQDKIKSGDKLTNEEEEELARSSALYKKADNKLKKMIAAAAEVTTLDDEKMEEIKTKTTAKR